MKAIILAAGKGTRLKKYHNLSKGLRSLEKIKSQSWNDFVQY